MAGGVDAGLLWRAGRRVGVGLGSPAFGGLRWGRRVGVGVAFRLGLRLGVGLRLRLGLRLGVGRGLGELVEGLGTPTIGAQRWRRHVSGIGLASPLQLGARPLRLAPRGRNVRRPRVLAGHPESLRVVIVVDPALSGVQVRGRIPLGVVVGVHPRGPATGAHHPVVRPAGQAHLVDVGVAAVAPVGDRVVHLAAVGRYGAAGLRAAAVAQDDRQSLRRRGGPAGPEEVQHLARDVVEHPEVAVGVVLGSQLDEVLDGHGRAAAGAGGAGHRHQVLQGGADQDRSRQPVEVTEVALVQSPAPDEVHDVVSTLGLSARVAVDLGLGRCSRDARLVIGGVAHAGGGELRHQHLPHRPARGGHGRGELGHLVVALRAHARTATALRSSSFGGRPS